jgi:hypothetical protein
MHCGLRRLHIDYCLQPWIVPVSVKPRAEQVEQQGHKRKHREEPVEQVQAAGDEGGAVEPPVVPAAGLRHAVDHRDQQAPVPRRDAEHAEDDGAADGPHAGGRRR